MQEIFESTYPEELYLIPPRLVVVIPVPWKDVAEEEKESLSKLLIALKQSLDSVVIRHQTHLDLSSWREKPKKVICFSPAEGLPLFEALPVEGTTVIVSVPMRELSANEDMKLKFWRGLQLMFK